MKEQFKLDVKNGLSDEPKTLPSKYFYDKFGDELFIKIMQAPEYYLTRAELEIFKSKPDVIIDGLDLKSDQPVENSYFELIELGAGDGTKTVHLLDELIKQNHQFQYVPIDISKNVLDQLTNDLGNKFPNLIVNAQHGDYFSILENFKNSNHPKVMLFLGSNLGNLDDQSAAEFIYALGASLNPGDKFILGVDLIKSAEIILPAYNDQLGYTRDFNLNLLKRINRELGGEFNPECFEHVPKYDESEGVAYSYLRSKMDQSVAIQDLEDTFHFKEGELIHTEISRKYSDEIIKSIFKKTDFILDDKICDSNEYFADYIFTKQ